jgi:hypothetical protein
MSSSEGSTGSSSSGASAASFLLVAIFVGRAEQSRVERGGEGTVYVERVAEGKGDRLSRDGERVDQLQGVGYGQCNLLLPVR